MPEGHAEPLLDSRQAAKIIDKSVSWITKERTAGRGPRFIRIGRSVRYRRADLDAYLDGSVVETMDTRAGGSEVTS